LAVILGITSPSVRALHCSFELVWKTSYSGSVFELVCSLGMNGKAWSAETVHLNSFSKAGRTVAFMMSPHLPPQVVILSVAVSA